MQQKSKHTFVKSKMNKDLDARLLEAGEYRDGVNVSVSRSESDDVGALENILGNELKNILSITPGCDVSPVEIIGWYRQENTNSIYLFLTSYQDNSDDGISNPAQFQTTHKIIYFNTESNTSQVIVEGYFLNFSINSPILHTNMVEDLLFWTDNRNQPRKINVKTAIANPTYYYNEDHISVAKYYPWNSIKVLESFTATGIVVDKNDTINGVTWPNGYNAWRNIIILKDDTSQETIDFLQGSIGKKGYAIDNNGDRWELTIAWCHKDYDNNPASTGQILPDYGAGYTGSGRLLVFVDREMDIGAPSPSPFTVSTPAAQTEYQFFFAGTTQKNVSSQWLEESKSKLEIRGFGDFIGVPYPPNALLYSGALPAAADDYCAPIYKYGTRSNKNGLSVPENGEATTALECPTFIYKQNVTTTKDYGLIKHPNIPENVDYYIGTNAINPVNPVGGFSWFEVVDKDGNPVNATALGLDLNDVVTIYWPNPHFKPNFSGDEKFLEDKFVRFSYRFRYDDGEVSVIAPFTQPIFIPKQKGYFEKRIGSTKVFPTDNDYFINQEQTAGENTIVDFFVNEVSAVNLQIPTEVPVNQLQNAFKVKEIDILYKESTELALKVVKTLDVTDTVIATNSTYTLPYEYQSEKPIKVLDSQEISRVFDNVPVRAAAQESSGNRIIYGNFYDRHTSPLTLDYLVGASPKFTLQNIQTSNSNISYPNHTLKQNRTYQAGIVLADRYGRQSDVILSSFVGDAHTVSFGPYGSTQCVFGGSTLYHPYFNTVTEPVTATAVFNTVPHFQAGIWEWPGDSLKILFSNTIPSSISTAEGYPGLYDENITTIQVLADPTVSGDVVTIEIDGAVGVLSEIAPGMTITWTNPTGDVFTNEISGVYFPGGGPYLVFMESKAPWNDPLTDPAIGDFLLVSTSKTLGWYSYKVVVKQQEQEYYNVYLASLLNGNPVVKPFELAMAAAVAGDTRLTVDATMADPRTYLLLEGMDFQWGGIEYTITNILNNEQFDITPPLAVGWGAATNRTFTTKSTKNSINVTTLLTDNANKIPPALIETTPVQQQYSTSQTRLIPRVAVNLEYNPLATPTTPYIGYYPNINGPIFPGKESAKVNALGNFESMFIDGSYAGLWQANTDPPALITQNKWQLGVFAESAKPDTSSKAPDQLVFSCYETTPTKSELEIFYETTTSGLVSELNKSISDGLNIPVKIANWNSITKETLGTVDWREDTDVLTTPIIGQFQFLDGQDNPLLYSGVGATIDKFTYINDEFQNGVFAGIEFPAPLPRLTTYLIEESLVPAEIAAGVYNIKLNSYAAGNYHREDPVFNNIHIDVSIDVAIFGSASDYRITYPFQINTLITNHAPYVPTDPIFIANTPIGPLFQSMLALDTPAISYGINNNTGTAETKDDSIVPYPSIYGTKTKTFNGANTFTLNKVTPPNFGGSEELVYELGIETYFGSGVYKTPTALGWTGLSLTMLTNVWDLGEEWLLDIGDVQQNGNPAVAPIGIQITATDNNGTGLSSAISRFGINIIY